MEAKSPAPAPGPAFKWTCDEWAPLEEDDPFDPWEQAVVGSRRQQEADLRSGAAVAEQSRRERAKERAKALAWKHRVAAQAGLISAGRPKQRAKRILDPATRIAATFRSHQCRIALRRKTRAATCLQAVWRGWRDRHFSSEMKRRQETLLKEESERVSRHRRILNFKKELSELKKLSANELEARYRAEHRKRMLKRLERWKQEEDEVFSSLGITEGSPVDAPAAAQCRLTTEAEHFEAKAIDAYREAAATSRLEASLRDNDQENEEWWFSNDNTMLGATIGSNLPEQRLERLFVKFKAKGPVHADNEYEEYFDATEVSNRLYDQFVAGDAVRRAKHEERARFRAWAIQLAEQLTDTEWYNTKYDWSLPKRSHDLESAIKAHESAMAAAKGEDKWHTVRLPGEYGLGTAVDIRNVKPLWPGEHADTNAAPRWDENEASVWWFAFARGRLHRHLVARNNEEKARIVAGDLIDKGQRRLVDFAKLGPKERSAHARRWVQQQNRLIETWQHQIKVELEQQMDLRQHRAASRLRDVRAQVTADRNHVATLIQKTWRGYLQRVLAAATRKQHNILGAIDCILNELADAPPDKRQRVVAAAISQRLLRSNQRAVRNIVPPSPPTQRSKPLPAPAPASPSPHTDSGTDAKSTLPLPPRTVDAMTSPALPAELAVVQSASSSPATTNSKRRPPPIAFIPNDTDSKITAARRRPSLALDLSLVVHDESKQVHSPPTLRQHSRSDTYRGSEHMTSPSCCNSSTTD